jgi:hypothetical protein
MRQMAARLGIDVDEHRWPRLVQAATFESMRSRADTTVPVGGPEHWIDPAAFFSCLPAPPAGFEPAHTAPETIRQDLCASL